MGLFKAGALLLLLIGAAKSQFDGLMTEGCVKKGVGYKGQQIRTQITDSHDQCKEKCKNEGSCKYWTWKKPTGKCTLFQTKDAIVGFQDALGRDDSYTLDDIISGPKICKAPFEDLKKQYCALSLDEKRKMLAREDITGQQVEDLLATVRTCSAGKPNSCQHPEDQVMDSDSPLIGKINAKLAELCDKEKENDKDCDGEQDKAVAKALDLAESQATILADREVEKASKVLEGFGAAFASLKAAFEYNGAEAFKKAAKGDAFKKSVTDALADLKTKVGDGQTGFFSPSAVELDEIEIEILEGAENSIAEGNPKKLVDKINEKESKMKGLKDKAKRKAQTISKKFGQAKKFVKRGYKKVTTKNGRRHLGSPKSQAKAMAGLGKMTTGLGLFLNSKDENGKVDPMKIGQGVMSVIDGIAQMLPAPISTITGLVSSILSIFTGGGGPSTEEVIKDEFKKQREFIEKQFKQQQDFMKKMFTQTEVETIKENALGMLDALESRHEFISAYEDVGGCLSDDAISEITLRVRYFMDQAGAYSVKHAFSNKCAGELKKVDVRQSQKTCTFLLYTYLTIEEKRHEILTIMMSLLSNSEKYEELNQGYLKVLSHQKQTLRLWLQETFKDRDTYCGLFKHHNDVWGGSQRRQHIQNIIFHFAPSVKSMDRKCLDITCQVENWKCLNNYGNLETKREVRNPGLCMVACSRHEKCMYWNYEKATKDCFLLSVCGKVVNKYLSTYSTAMRTKNVVKNQEGWVMGAKKCQTIEENKDDRGTTCKNLKISYPNTRWVDRACKYTARTTCGKGYCNKERDGWCPKNAGSTCFMHGITWSAHEDRGRPSGIAGYPMMLTDANQQNPEYCQKVCESLATCYFFSYRTTDGACYLMRNIWKIRDGDYQYDNGRKAADYISGYKRCAQGQYGATWLYGVAGKEPVKIQGCPNIEMCRKFCNGHSNCNAWTFNIQTFECKLYTDFVPTATNFKKHDSGTISDTPWVSGPVTLL